MVANRSHTPGCAESANLPPACEISRGESQRHESPARNAEAKAGTSRRHALASCHCPHRALHSWNKRSKRSFE